MTLKDALKQVALFLQQGQTCQAITLCRAILNVTPSNFDVLYFYGNASTKAGNLADAIVSYKKALQLRPNEPQLLNNLGVALNYTKNHEEAIACYKKALQLCPNYPEAHCNMGIALTEMKIHEEAIVSYKEALKLCPDSPDINYNLGIALNEIKHHEEAIAAFNISLQASPNDSETYNNLGVTFNELKRHEEAVASYRKALQINPNKPETLCNLGIALNELNHHWDAINCYKKALRVQPNFSGAYYNLGVTLLHLKHHDEAIAYYKKALQLNSNGPESWNNLGVALNEINRHREAITSYKKAIELCPNKPETYYNLGNAQNDLKRHKDAIISYEQALNLNAYYSNALIKLAIQKRKICDWRDYSELQRKLETCRTMTKEPFAPFDFLTFSDNPAELLLNTRRYIEQEIRRPIPPHHTHKRNSSSRVKLAYLSADFHQHATCYLMAELFERHDREKFEIHAVSYGPDIQDAMRQRLVAAFDHFHDVRNNSDAEVAELIRGLGIQIAVDLKGYTGGCRPSILAYRPAPIQVTYLGYPGTMGANFIDYILVDKFIAPNDQQEFFTEKLVQLPNCYQANDSTREIASDAPSRNACGLPASGFVFCCFNNNYKITPAIFDVWMRLLDELPDSVLWLLKDNESVEHNLRLEAEKRHVNPDRLIFASRLDLAHHLARHQHANLFLDTFPINAHTTASDALWAGLPVLTYAGNSFASRVAGSLLHAIGLHDLVTDSLEEYETKALEIAKSPILLQSYRRKLANNRQYSSLFNCERFTRNLETAYIMMVGHWEKGGPPEAFCLSDLTGR